MSSADASLWLHRPSGLLLPRGAVVASQLSEDELAEVEMRSAGERGRAAAERRAPRRARRDAEVLEALCVWCRANSLDCMGTVTFSDRYAEANGIYTPKRALDDVWRGLVSEVPLRGSRGFWGRFVMAAEWHRTGRNVPHVHLAFEGTGNRERLCDGFQRFFRHSRGFSVFSEMWDINSATLYGLKDVLKEDSRSADGFRFRMQDVRRRS